LIFPSGLAAVLACSLVAAVGWSADPTATGPGARAFQKCYACHSLDPREPNLPGPNLHKLFGRVAGSLPGFDYSEAMVTAGRRKGLVWDEGSLDRYLADPESLVPGTLMAMVSIKDPAERKTLIEYLKHATE
jgi:cytochrome c